VSTNSAGTYICSKVYKVVIEATVGGVSAYNVNELTVELLNTPLPILVKLGPNTRCEKYAQWSNAVLPIVTILGNSALIGILSELILI
jgi:hypothetical protein